MRPDVEYLHQQWEGLVEEYDEAKKEFDEAARDLEKVRCEKEAFLAQILFGVA